MFSVLIVDDEEPVLESYEFMLRRFTGGGEDSPPGTAAPPPAPAAASPFTLAGKARTGYEALKLIHETAPDLVFMDINIPGIDGLSVLEDVHKKYPRMVCVLSTAYERFDLARRAIPLGVFAYLVKPVSKKTFFATLENALAELRSRPPESSEYADPRQALFRRDIWAAMSEPGWEQYRETLSLPSEKGLVFLLETEKDTAYWAGRAAEALSYKHHCSYDVMLNRGLFLVFGDLNPGTFRHRTEKLLAELLAPVAFYCGFGGLYRGPELYRSCSEALAELSAKRRESDPWSRARKTIARLRRVMGIAPREETKALFAAVWEPLFAEDFALAKIRMVSLFTLLVDDLYGEAPAPLDPADIMELADLAAWKRWAEPNIDRLALKAGVDRQGNYPLPLIKALAYVQENYSRGIQLGDAAEAAGAAPSYVSRLFSEHLKTTFIDYLTGLRINEAERLLKASPISVKEAAYAAGFRDPNYFSKTFKKIKGILPTEVT
ncbi:MAG: helix-turn-helix domain-containing protein [Treponema sp.]|nr:helix-turn-helix domain-containing protein [Treponema sp.]